MTKARDLANLISTGNPLADGALSAEKKVEWATYRTALRNLPSSSDWPDVTFPTEPS